MHKQGEPNSFHSWDYKPLTRPESSKMNVAPHSYQNAYWCKTKASQHWNPKGLPSHLLGPGSSFLVAGYTVWRSVSRVSYRGEGCSLGRPGLSLASSPDNSRILSFHTSPSLELQKKQYRTDMAVMILVPKASVKLATFLNLLFPAPVFTQ